MERIRQRAVISPSYNPPISQTTLGKGRVPQDTLTAFLSPIIFFPINILAHFGQNRFHLIWLLLTLQSRPWKKQLKVNHPFHIISSPTRHWSDPDVLAVSPSAGRPNSHGRLYLGLSFMFLLNVCQGQVPQLPLDASLFLLYTLY